MKIALCHGIEGSESGTKLANCLIEAGLDVTFGNRNEISESEETFDLLINYGCSFTLSSNPSIRTINVSRAIKQAANKREAYIKMIQAGVSCPNFIDLTGDLLGVTIPAAGLIARKDYHQMGSEIYECNSIPDLRAAIRAGCTHATEKVRVAQEIRFHIFNTSIDGEEFSSIKATQKSTRDGSPIQADVARHHSQGYQYVLTTPNDALRATAVYQAAREEAKKAVKACGLTFGAVDVLLGADGRPYVLEVNTAPCLTDGNTTSDKYVETITAYVAALERAGTSRPAARTRATPTRAAAVEAPAATYNRSVIRSVLSRVGIGV